MTSQAGSGEDDDWLLTAFDAWRRRQDDAAGDAVASSSFNVRRLYADFAIELDYPNKRAADASTGAGAATAADTDVVPTASYAVENYASVADHRSGSVVAAKAIDGDCNSDGNGHVYNDDGGGRAGVGANATAAAAAGVASAPSGRTIVATAALPAGKAAFTSRAAFSAFHRGNALVGSITLGAVNHDIACLALLLLSITHLY
jgi:hypothetical protein